MHDISKIIKCRDCDSIPKVDFAGEIVSDFQIMHNGLKIIKGCYHEEWMSEIISACRGHHEPQEERAFHEVLKHIANNAVMIELGSFWAYYSMWFNQSVLNAKNYLIDIDEPTLNVGKLNFGVNNMSGNFYIDSVPNFKLENFLKTNNIEFVDILHVDIQGWEYHMLLDSQTSLDKIGYFFISTHTDQFNTGHHWGSPKEKLHESCLEFLLDNNYIILCEHNMSESFSHDGLIVAKNPKISTDFNKIEISKYVQSHS